MSDNLEIFSLLWLDAAVNTSKENIDAQPHLRAIINHLKTFDNDEKCEKYIRNMHQADRIVLIVSGGLGREIVPRIYKLQQVSSIYVYCMDMKKNKQWANQYSKVKLLTSSLDNLIDQIETDQSKKKKKIEEQLSINYLEADYVQDRSSTGLNGQFLHSQLLIDCLLGMDSTPEDKKKLISLCKKRYKGNKKEIDVLHDFKQNYSSDQALWWYTKESFLYRMLNKALRVQDIDTLYLFRFFIRDLRHQIEKHRCSTPIRIYRGQSISNNELQGLSNSVGKLISMNSFVSTSLDRKKALVFTDTPDDFQPVLFEIDADPRLDGVKPFADVGSHGAFPDEKEVLIMLGSIFRVLDVRRSEGPICIIKMTLCSNNDNNLRVVFQHMRKESIVASQEQSRLSLGIVLHKMGKFEDAEKFFRRLLDELPRDHKDIAGCYLALANLASEKGDHGLSLEWHHHSLEIKMRTLKPDDPDLAQSYNCIGNAYANKSDHQQALQSYNKAMTIWRQAYGDQHSDFALCLNNMGIVFQKEKQHSSALDCHYQALAIRKKCLPANHPDLGQSYNNLGLAYEAVGYFKDALEHLNQSLIIKMKSLPSQHPFIAGTLENIGSIYEKKGELQQALTFYQKAAGGYRHTYDSQHEKIVNIEKKIRHLTSQLK